MAVDNIDNIGAVPAPQAPEPAQDKSSQDKWLAGFMSLIKELEEGFFSYYVPQLQAAQMMTSGAEAILAILTSQPYDKDKNPDGYNANKILTDFLNGWTELLELQKNGDLPDFAKKFLDNPLFQQLYSKVKEMADIEASDPDYQNNPTWKADYADVNDPDTGLLAQLYKYGQDDANKDVVDDAEIFAQSASSSTQVFYQQCTAALGTWNSVVQATTGYLKDLQSLWQFSRQLTNQ